MLKIETTKAPGAIGPYSQGYIYNGLFYSSGQICLIPETGKLIEGGIKEQTHQVCKNIGELLKAAGTDFSKVIKTTCFLDDMNNFCSFNEVYAQYFTSNPARSCVAVKTLPKNVLCEIEVIAFV